MDLSYIRLLVTDLEACYDFYAEVLGLSVTWGQKGEAYVSFQASDGTMLSLYEQKRMLEHLGIQEAGRNGYRMTLVFSAQDVDREYRRLQERGAQFLTEPHDVPGWGCRCFHLADPEGNLVEITQMLSKESWDEELKSHPDASQFE